MLQFSPQWLNHFVLIVFNLFVLAVDVGSKTHTPKPTLVSTAKAHPLKTTIKSHRPPVTKKIATTLAAFTNSTINNTAHGSGPKSMSNIVRRAFYVISAICVVVVFYFVVRAVYSRRRRSKTRRYGMLRQEGGDMELRPLSEGEDDEEEDLTLFDASQRKSVTRR